jgi:hypothetical protein
VPDDTSACCATDHVCLPGESDEHAVPAISTGDVGKHAKPFKGPRGPTRASRQMPDMFGANGKPDLGKARLTTEQANALRSAGRAGGHVTVSGAGRMDASRQCSNASPIPTNVIIFLEVPRIGRCCGAQRTRGFGLAELGSMPGRATRGFRRSQAPVRGLTT